MVKGGPDEMPVFASVLKQKPKQEVFQSGGDQPASWTKAFLVVSVFDPRALVDRVEELPIDPKLANDAFHARLAVSESLAQTQEERCGRPYLDRLER
jgi:hypothetical protein